jgi:hypothetical protein
VKNLSSIKKEVSQRSFLKSLMLVAPVFPQKRGSSGLCTDSRGEQQAAQQIKVYRARVAWVQW